MYLSRENDEYKEEGSSEACISQGTQGERCHSKGAGKEGYGLEGKNEGYTYIKGTYCLCSKAREHW